MNKLLITLIAVISCYSALSAELPNFMLSYGTRGMKWNYYNQLNRYQYFNISKPIRYIGLEVQNIVMATNRDRLKTSALMEYHQVIPFNLQINDTVVTKVSGFNFGFSTTENITKKNKNIAIFPYAGINTGRLHSYGKAFCWQKNPYLSPKIGLAIKCAIGRLGIGIRTEYDWDISKPSWRRMLRAKGEQLNMNPLKQSGLNVFASIGIALY